MKIGEYLVFYFPADPSADLPYPYYWSVVIAQHGALLFESILFSDGSIGYGWYDEIPMTQLQWRALATGKKTDHELFDYGDYSRVPESSLQFMNAFGTSPRAEIVDWFEQQNEDWTSIIPNLTPLIAKGSDLKAS